jgi:hypothetical protein
VDRCESNVTPFHYGLAELPALADNVSHSKYAIVAPADA